jgi:hypothetical protein
MNQSLRGEETAKSINGPRPSPREATANRKTATVGGEDPAGTAGCEPRVKAREGPHVQTLAGRLGRCWTSAAAAAVQLSADATKSKSGLAESRTRPRPPPLGAKTNGSIGTALRGVVTGSEEANIGRAAASGLEPQFPSAEIPEQERKRKRAKGGKQSKLTYDQRKAYRKARDGGNGTK